MIFDPPILVLLFAAAFVAGAMNSVAGGGTLLTFPALLAILTPLYHEKAGAWANATSTVALLPGSIAAVWGYRKEMQEAKSSAWRLMPSSVIGAVIGSLLLLWMPDQFTPLVPWLLLTAAVLFLIQPVLSKLRKPNTMPAPPSTARIVLLMLLQVIIATYGGYFGAGMGIVILATLGFMGVTNIHHANGVKTLLASVVNGISAVLFLWGGLVHVPVAVYMAVAAILGGYAGARVARRLPTKYVRWSVIVVAFGLAGYYAWKQLVK
jgi:uncharacterized protein